MAPLHSGDDQEFIRIQYCFYSNGAAHWSIHSHVIQIIWRSCELNATAGTETGCLCRVGAKTPVYAECSCRVQKVKLWKLKLRLFRLRKLGTEHYRASHKRNSFRQNSDHGKETCSTKLKLLRKMKSTALKSGLACDRQGWRNGGILLDGFSGIGERYLLSIVAWGRTSTGSRSGFRTRAEGLVDSSSPSPSSAGHLDARTKPGSKYSCAMWRSSILWLWRTVTHAARTEWLVYDWERPARSLIFVMNLAKVSFPRGAATKYGSSVRFRVPARWKIRSTFGLLKATSFRMIATCTGSCTCPEETSSLNEERPPVWFFWVKDVLNSTISLPFSFLENKRSCLRSSSCISRPRSPRWNVRINHPAKVRFVASIGSSRVVLMNVPIFSRSDEHIGG